MLRLLAYQIRKEDIFARLKMKQFFSYAFLISALVVFSNGTSAQTLSEDSWVRIAVDSESQWSFHAKSIKFDSLPPTAVSVNIRRHIDKTHLPFEFRCRERRVIVNGVPTSLASERNTMRRLFYDGFCGMEYEGGVWVLIGAAFPRGEPLKHSHYIFADLSSTYVVEKPFSGRVTRLLRMNHDPNRSPTFSPFMGEEIAVDCANPKRYALRGPSASEFSVFESAAVNSLAHSWSFLFCTSGWPVSSSISQGRSQTKALALPNKPSISSFQDVLKTCEEFGHQRGTEKFGECVMSLSR